MATTVALRWSVPPETLAKAVGDYGKRLLAAVYDLGQFFAAKMAAYAKQTAPWTDRTGNARQSLTGIAVKTATGIVIYLAGLMSYSIFLEVANGGRYQVILPTMERHYPEIMAALRRLVS